MQSRVSECVCNQKIKCVKKSIKKGNSSFLYDTWTELLSLVTTTNSLGKVSSITQQSWHADVVAEEGRPSEASVFANFHEFFT